jgi:hypothetical protein
MRASADQEYYQHVRKISVAERLGGIARKRIYDLFLELMKPDAGSRILDLGVTDQIDSPSANVLERLYPTRGRIVCAGLCDGSPIKAAYPGVEYVRIGPGQRLPFADEAFDMAFSNAVLEHVGSRRQQAEFVAEACRVARGVFIAVPNRFFPFEVHTGIPLLHYLPNPLFRAILRLSPFRTWSYEENLNYVSRRELIGMYPLKSGARVTYTGVGWGPFRSNLVSYREQRRSQQTGSRVIGE